MQTLSPSDVSAMLDHDEIHLVDVREADEFAQARITGAINAPLSQLASLLPTLPTDKPIVFHCLAGGRSARAVDQALGLGYAIDAHMGGGLKAWVGVGLPIE